MRDEVKRLAQWPLVLVAVLLLAGCGAEQQRSQTPQPAATSTTPDLSPRGCPPKSHWRNDYGFCMPDRAGAPRGQHANGGLRFIREPLVQLFPGTRTMTVFYRLNRLPWDYVITKLDDTDVIAQNENNLGYDDVSHRGHCFRQTVDMFRESFGRSLRHPRVGQSVRVRISIGGRHRARVWMSTRIRQALPRDSSDVGGFGWWEALGCRSEVSPG